MFRSFSHADIICPSFLVDGDDVSIYFVWRDLILSQIHVVLYKFVFSVEVGIFVMTALCYAHFI